MPSFRAWNQEEKWHEGAHDPVQPGAEHPFLGPLVVLIGPGTVSAAEDFLIPLHHQWSDDTGWRENGRNHRSAPSRLPPGREGQNLHQTRYLS